MSDKIIKIEIDGKERFFKEVLEVKEDNEYKMKNVAIVLGHTDGLGLEKDKGAYSKFFKKTEWYFYNKNIDKYKGIADIFTHDSDVTSYTQRQRLMAEKTKNYELVFELHFNSYNTTVNGCEAKHYITNKKTKNSATLYCKLVSEKMGIKNRGAKPMKSTDRGTEFITFTKGGAIILEPFYGDNDSDCEKFDHDTHVEIIKEVIDNYFKK